MARAARRRAGGRASLLLFAALAGGAAVPGCAPSSLRGRSIAEPLDTSEAIVKLGCAGDTAYALTRSGKLRAWNLRTRALQTLPRGDAIAIARDGTVALSASGPVVEVWEPKTGRAIATHRFEHGIVAARAVSPARAYVVAKRGPINWPPNASIPPPPDTELVSWDFATGKIDVMPEYRACDDVWLSADGVTSLCDGTWRSWPALYGKPPPPLAPEWTPPDLAPPPAQCRKCGPHISETGHSLLSAWLSADGLSVYLTYRRTVGGTEWRLDRWSPDQTGKTAGSLERIAVSHEAIADRVVAVSRDGRTVLTDPGERPPVLRHAPGYEGAPLLAPPVTAAAFSEDERLLVTGHGDGRLRVWDAASGRLVSAERTAAPLGGIASPL